MLAAGASPARLTGRHIIAIVAADDVRATMWQEPSGGWRAVGRLDPPVVVRSRSRDRCLERLRGAVAERSGSRAPAIVVVDVVPRLAGVAEAAEILGWDKRRVVTYIDRGRFPEPLEQLAGGRVWRRSDIEDYAAARRARRRA